MGISDAFVTTGELNPLGLFYLISSLCVCVYERGEDAVFRSPFFLPGSLGTREASGRGPGCDEGKWDWGLGEGGVVSDLTLKSVPCPSSPGVVPHSQVGGEGAQNLACSGVKNMEEDGLLTQVTAL